MDLEPRLRILVVAQDFPWPATYGSRIRLANVVRALGQVGDIDLFTFLWPGGTHEPPTEPLVDRWRVVPRPIAERNLMQKLTWLVRGRLPSDFLGRDLGSVRETFRRWIRPPYDLVWFSRVEPYVAFGPLVEGPAILDVDDLADQRLRTQLAVSAGTPGRSVRRAVQGLPRTLKERRDIALWDRLQKQVCGSVATGVVCSEIDRERLGARNVEVVPNGYEAPARPAGHAVTRRPPAVLFPATFGYPANVDAAYYLVREIGPSLRARVGGLQIRLVGRSVRSVDDLADPPRVVVTGVVPTMEPELAAADVVAVPLRIGTGTRIKILEAFAHKIPVVSTGLGAEGLDVAHGRHLLIADDPDGFASACARILDDEGLRHQLVEEAHELFVRRYRWSAIRSHIAELALARASIDPAKAALGS
jgi:glycosyltransferase involved in cell wall biosynthesis